MEKELEGKKTDNLEETSASTPVELNSSPVPEETTPIESEPVPATPVVEENPVATENVETPVAVEENTVVEENGVTETPALKTFTQNQVNEMVGNTRTETREKTFRYIYDRYGVNNEAELDDLIGNAQRYDSLNEQYEGDKKMWKESEDARNKELADVKEQVALMQSGIDSSRYEDAKFILRGKGLEVNLENIQNEIATHPEWQKGHKEEEVNPNFAKIPEPESKISVLGNDSSAPVDDEEARAMRLFKV